MWSNALEDALFKRAPDGWTFSSPYPRIFSRRRSTYLLTELEKERLAGGVRRCLRTTRLVIFGVCVLAAVPLAFWLPDMLRLLLTGSPGAWLLLCLVVLLIGGILPSAIVITHYRLVHPVLHTARWIGPADAVSGIGLLAETTSARRRILRVALAFLTCGLMAYLTAYVPPSSPDADVLLTLSVLIGLASVWDAALLVVKLKAQRLNRSGRSL